MVLPCFVRRLIETIFVPTIVSIVFGLIVMFNESLRITPVIFTILMCVCLLTVLIINAYMLRSYFFFVKNTFDYFTVNLLVYAVALVINLTVYFLCKGGIIPQALYENVYFVYNFFCVFGVSVLPSTLFVHGIMIIMIFLAPFELYSVISRMNRSVKK